MSSPALRHRQAKLAQLAAAQSGSATGRSTAPAMPADGPVASEYQLILAQLGIDLQALKQIQSTERKIAAKRQMIGAYLPWIEGALAQTHSGPAPQDDVVTTMLIWAIDTREWPLALRLAEHVLTHGLALPERYKRPPAVLIAEEVAEAELLGDPADTVHPMVLAQIDALTELHDMPDQVRAKLAKAQGVALARIADTFDPQAESALAGGRAGIYDAALTQFERALRLDDGSGVKKLLEATTRARSKVATGDTT